MGASPCPFAAAGSPPKEFAFLSAAFFQDAVGNWQIRFTEPIDLTVSVIDLADWAVFGQGGWTPPTQTTSTSPPGQLVLRNADYTDLDNRIRYTGPFGKIVSTRGSFLVPFDEPTS